MSTKHGPKGKNTGKKGATKAVGKKVTRRGKTIAASDTSVAEPAVDTSMVGEGRGDTGVATDLPETTARDAVVGRRYTTAKGHEVAVKSKGNSHVMVVKTSGGAPFTIAASTKLRGPIPEAPAGTPVEDAGATAEPVEKAKRVVRSIEELQALFLQVVGRATTSTHRGYLLWKVSEARKGRVPVGPIARRAARPKEEMQVLPLGMARETVAKLDAAVKASGFKNRMGFIRAALVAMLRQDSSPDALTAAAAIEAESAA